jgi:trimethylamine:corrinoid methyltransferase-like protein
MPSLLTRQHYEVWRQEGAKDMAQRVQDSVHKLHESHTVPSLPGSTLAALERLVQEGIEELTRH